MLLHTILTNLHIKAAAYVAVVDNNSPASHVQLAAALTSARRAPEALTVLKTNEGARAFYAKIGYEETDHAPAGAHYVILRKRI